MKFLVTERQLKTIVNFLNEGLEYEDISGSSSMKPLSLKDNKYFVLHHTAGGKSASAIMSVLNKRELGVQWIIDREGKIYKSSPGNKAWHVKRTPGMGPDDLGNSTAQGVEIIANNNDDVIEDVQCPAALKLVKSLGISPSNIYGHGEVSKHKAKDEGAKCKAYILKNWGNETGEPIVTQNTKDVEQKTTDGKKQTFFELLKNFNYIVKSNETINNDSDPTKKSILNKFLGLLKKDSKVKENENIDDYITSKIKELQKEKGLPETGVYDDKTVDALFKDTLINMGYNITNSTDQKTTNTTNMENKTEQNKGFADFASITKRVIDKFEGGYWHGPTPKNEQTAKLGICKNHPKGSMGKSTETMFGLDRYNGDIESIPGGKEFFNIIDQEKQKLGMDGFCKKWKWLYRGGEHESQLKDLAVKIMEGRFNKNMNNYVKDSETKNLIMSNPGLLLHMSYATWNGPGFFKKFAKSLENAVKNGKKGKELIDLAISDRNSTGLLNKGKVEAEVRAVSST